MEIECLSEHVGLPLLRPKPHSTFEDSRVKWIKSVLRVHSMYDILRPSLVKLMYQACFKDIQQVSNTRLMHLFTYIYRTPNSAGDACICMAYANIHQVLLGTQKRGEKDEKKRKPLSWFWLHRSLDPYSSTASELRYSLTKSQITHPAKLQADQKPSRKKNHTVTKIHRRSNSSARAFDHFFFLFFFLFFLCLDDEREKTLQA